MEYIAGFYTTSKIMNITGNTAQGCEASDQIR
jgi:hypothetical protein